jgi:hypothetical protein
MPRQSVVYYVRDEERLLISTASKRLKARDVRRSENIGPAAAAVMQRIAGTPARPQAESDVALAAIDRVILAITIESVSAVNYLPDAG